MKSVKLLQIGDIHWPQYKKTSFLDKKDEAFPKGVLEQIEINPLQNAMRGVINYCQDGIDALLICGDLTSYGDIDGYKDCIDYLNRIFTSAGLDAVKINAVPGNHDINRKNCDPDGKDIYKKFIPLQDVWKSIKTNVLTTQHVRRQDNIPQDNCSFTVFSINSCVGCGEQRYLPKQIRAELMEIIKKFTDGKEKEEDFDLIGETLDTPAFSTDDVDEVRKQINIMKPEELPIILSHHNILPQKRPRVSLYSEVLNAGYIRSRLSRSNRPVIYCHGHVHQDPIEIVTVPEVTASRLVCIGAPELKDGFNIIEIQYGETNYPLGCIIRHVRIGDDGALETNNIIRVPLQLPSEILMHERISEFFGDISKEVKRFQEYVDKIRDHTGKNVQHKTVASTLLECEWLGLMQINNRSEDKKHWQIRGLV